MMSSCLFEQLAQSLPRGVVDIAVFLSVQRAGDRPGEQGDEFVDVGEVVDASDGLFDGGCTVAVW